MGNTRGQPQNFKPQASIFQNAENPDAGSQRGYQFMPTRSTQAPPVYRRSTQAPSA